MNIIDEDDLFRNNLAGGWDLPADPAPLPDTAAWIEGQGQAIASQDSELADLVAEVVYDLADRWRAVACGRPLSVADFKARLEVLEEFRDEMIAFSHANS